MSKKLVEVLIVSLISLFGLVTYAGALSYTTTNLGLDPDPGPAGITYTLTWSGTSPYNATLTISVPTATSKKYWAGGFLFTFDQSNRANIEDLIKVSGGSGTWLISDGDYNSSAMIRIGNTYGNFLPGSSGFSGFYLQSVSQGFPFNPSLGVPLSVSTFTDGVDNPYKFTFDFELTGGWLNTEEMPFKVAIYSGMTPTGPNRYKWEGWISKELQVPEPSTLLLLGAGLVGLGILGRRKFRS